MKSFQNKVAVITGAGSGLGRALALQFNQIGANLALCDIDETGLTETKNLLAIKTSKTSLHTVDVSILERMNQFELNVIDQHGQVDILINNAGITLTPTPFGMIPNEQFEKVIQINMWGVYNGIKVFLPHLQTRPEASIVTISSLAGLVGLTGYAPYAMSKFAVRGLTESLGMEFTGSKIHFMVVHPGGIKTNIIRNAPDLQDSNKDDAHDVFTRAALLTPENCAKKILHGIQKKRNRLILGIDAKIVFSIRKIFPRKYPVILNAVFSQMKFK